MKLLALAVVVAVSSLSALRADQNEKLIKELRAEYAYLLEETKISPEARTRQRTRGKLALLGGILGGMAGRNTRREIYEEELASYQLKLQQMNTIMRTLDSLTRQKVTQRQLLTPA
jgi:hypothetical protein